MLTGRVTRLSEFGAFVELEAGVEALAHALDVRPTGKPGGWSKSVTSGQTSAFEILSIEPDKEAHPGVALVDEGSSRRHGANRRARP